MRKLLALAIALVVLASPVAAMASSRQVITDCNSHGLLTRHYPTAELRQALSSLPADVKEYTNCYDVIQRALLEQVGGPNHAATKGGSGSGGSFLPTPLIVLLILLALVGAGLVWLTFRRRTGEGRAGGS